MRKSATAAAVLSAAVAAALALLSPSPLPAQAVPPAAAAGEKAAPQASVPVKQVVLYSSGVGYFEHFGTVKGSGSTELRFKTAQVNDILKSLVLQDMDKGKIGVITYPSQDPVSKTLRSFQVDITSNPGVAQLLGQLRGARVAVQSGAEKVVGTVLGVEQKPRPVGGDKDGKGAQVVNVWFVNLITEAGQVRSVSLEDVRDVELQDPKLREELGRALAALAAARDTDKKPVNISFTGEGERRVRIGYVVETPVWKTSYRLQLADPQVGAAGAGAADAKPAAVAEAERAVADLTKQLGGDHPTVKARQRELDELRTKAGGGAGAAAAARKNTGALQGWAIVENQTDNDWADVQLSLVSGRPISFVQDLYQPLYVPRPVVQAELYASLRPQTYDAGLAGAKETERFTAATGAELQQARQELRNAAPAARKAADAKGQAPLGGMAGGYRGGRQADQKAMEQAAAFDPMDMASSVNSVASAAKLGELFQYTVGNVNLPRQTSAMIPVVTDAVEVEKLSIYNMAVLPKNPLLGARLKNSTGKHLLQGPVTVLDAGRYAGDARIDDVPPGQERLISYGVDQQVIVQAKNDSHTGTLVTGKVIKGVLHLTYKEVNSQDYTADNKGDGEKTLVIEHPKLGGDWKLVEPAKADETTDALYRFKGTVGAGKATKLTVRQELVRGEQIAILPMDAGQVLA
ncbi:MAG TPA: hypothetical protein VF796_27255, partial [Humisphaera sp.]